MSDIIKEYDIKPTYYNGKRVIKDLQEQLEQLHKDSLHADHVIAENRELKARNEKLERVVDNFTDRYKLGDSIRQAYLKHGNDSWCSIADDVIKELKDD